MHIHAQIEVDLDRTEVLVLSGSDQHAAIATSITTSIATSITISTPPWSMFGAIGARFNPSLEHVWSYQGQGGQEVHGIVKTRGFVDLDVRWSVKTRVFLARAYVEA